MAEEKEQIAISLEDVLGVTVTFYEHDVKSIRIFPACKYADCGARTLSPAELNEAVEMWMNRAPANGPARDNLDAALAEKDAEITRLNEKYNEATASPHYPGGPWDWLHKANMENRELKNRIADLEKLSTMQKATIDAQGKDLGDALRNARGTMRAELIKEIDKGINQYAGSPMCNGLMKAHSIIRHALDPVEKEPELFICPNSGIKPGCDHCDHRVPHQHKGKLCEDHLCGMPCSICKGVGCKCIPYKEPAQTSQSKQSPVLDPEVRYYPISEGELRDAVKDDISLSNADMERNTKILAQILNRDAFVPSLTKDPVQHLQDRVLELEQHQGRDRADVDEIKGYISQVVTEINKILSQTTNKTNEDNIGLWERVNIVCDDVHMIESAITRLEDKTSRELSQAFAEVNRVLAEHKKRDDAAQERIKGLEHRLGLAQDRIAEIHPGGCVPPGKSEKTCSSCRNWQGEGYLCTDCVNESRWQPKKSRLKTDRVKRAKP